MSRRLRPHYRSDLGWILGVAFVGTLTRSARPVQGFTFVRCCGTPRASSPHDLAAPGLGVSRRPALRAVASGSRLLPTRPAKDFHLQFSAHARHTYHRDADGFALGREVMIDLLLTLEAERFIGNGRPTSRR